MKSGGGGGGFKAGWGRGRRAGESEVRREAAAGRAPDPPPPGRLSGASGGRIGRGFSEGLSASLPPPPVLFRVVRLRGSLAGQEGGTAGRPARPPLGAE